ncbi:MAG: penicillin-binding protein 2 [Pseudomonadota bacterium]
MNRDLARAKLFTRRAMVLAGAKLALFGGLLARMYYLQVVERDRYATLAEDNRINLRLLPPARGRILDRYGEELAANQLNYRAVVIPEQTGSVPETLEVLSNIVSVGEADRRRILRETTRRRRFLPVTIRDNLSWDDVSRIAVSAPDLPGIMIDVGASRHYPYGADLAHVVGYVAPPAEADLTGEPLLELPDFRVGRNGIERIYDLALRGRAGTSQVEVNALGRPIRELARAEGEPGHELALTLDLHLQRFATGRLAAEDSAAAVLMDVHTGEVLALASVPSYDPNEFDKGIPAPLWRALLDNARTPLVNKAIAGQFAPASIFKLMVAIAALESGAIPPDQRLHCAGAIELGDYKFHCWKKVGHGWIDMMEGIKQSCDVYFYEVARRLGIDRIAHTARRFGLGQTLALDLPGERAGLIPTREWKLATTGVPWQQGETLVAGIGQGYVLATPLQLAVMTARIVNGGLAVTPRLTRDLVAGRRVVARAPGAYPGIGVARETLAFVARAMRGVVNDPRGTAFRARILEPGLAMGGKTGTAQIRRITEEERAASPRKPHQVPWRERDHALFVGYAPADAPRYGLAVVVEHGGGGAAVAAPIARDILREAQLRARARPEPRDALAPSPGDSASGA